MDDGIIDPLGFSHVRLTVTDIRRSKAFYERLFGRPPGSDFSDEIADLHDAARRLDDAGIPHGEITDLPPFGLVILSVQDPDDINLELAAPRSEA